MAEILRSPEPTRYLRERSGVLLTMAITGGALLLLPVLLTLQFAQLSNRAAESLEDALRGSLYPANLATLAVATVFGTSGSYWGPGAATLSEVAFTDDSENYLFVGASPMLVLYMVGVGAATAVFSAFTPSPAAETAPQPAMPTRSSTMAPRIGCVRRGRRASAKSIPRPGW